MQKQTMPFTPEPAKPVQHNVEFYGHAMTYLLIMTLLGWINLFTTPESFWSLWPMLAWGFALLRHGVKTFGSQLKHALWRYLLTRASARGQRAA